jgi:hypothetical protein
MVKEGNPPSEDTYPINFYRKVNKPVPLTSRYVRGSDRKAFFYFCQVLVPGLHITHSAQALDHELCS